MEPPHDDVLGGARAGARALVSLAKVVAVTAGVVALGGAVWVLVPRSQPALDAPHAPLVSHRRTATPLRLAVTIYDGGLRSGWQDWGWGPHELPEAGPARIGFAGYGGIIFRRDSDELHYGAFTFRYKAAFEDFLEVGLRNPRGIERDFPVVRVEDKHTAELGDGFREVLIPMAELNPGRLPFDRIVIKAHANVRSDWVLIDKVGLTEVDPLDPEQARVPERGAIVTVHCNQAATPIDPMIYGIAHGLRGTGETWHRIGGNPMTRLNWELGNAWNVGSDWFFENTGSDDRGLPDWLDEGVARGVKMGVVVPLIGWVAKDKTSVGFPVARFGKQRKVDEGRGAGDGHDPKGKALEPGPPSLTSVEAPPEAIGRWVRRVRAQDEARGSRGVHLYILDNEPSLWNETHRDIHPQPLTYAELLDRTIRYATEVRKADPEAVIAGPSEWGWLGYFGSRAPDRAAHGGAPLVPWYLKQLSQHEKQTGVRLLDVLNLHFYPAADGLYGPNAQTDPKTSALRLRSTRALWDPSYRDESWIDDEIRLIPRMKDWVRENYPGRKLAIGEWSFGAEEHISGGLAIAEALGRFGQQGLDAASYWVRPKVGTPAFWGFRAYRDYDGKGARFLDWSVPASSAKDVSLFASRNEQKSRMVLILLNTSGDYAVRARLDVSSCGAVTPDRAFSYAAGSPAITPEPTHAAAKELVQLLPPHSLRIVELDVSSKAQ